MNQITTKEAWTLYNELRTRVLGTIKDLVGDADVELTEEYYFNEIIDVDCTANYVIVHFTRDQLWLKETNENSIVHSEIEQKPWEEMNVVNLIHILDQIQQGNMTDYSEDN